MADTCDPKCYDLAEHFLADAAEDVLPVAEQQTRLMSLACAIQAAVENWLEEEAYALQQKAEHEGDPHERAAARARGNDFADTGGRDWT